MTPVYKVDKLRSCRIEKSMNQLPSLFIFLLKGDIMKLTARGKFVRNMIYILIGAMILIGLVMFSGLIPTGESNGIHCVQGTYRLSDGTCIEER